MTAASILATAALHQTQAKWDLPAAYPAMSFHTKTLAAFAADIDRATGSELKFTVHANA